MRILITGASSGIGFLTGCVLSSRGHFVVMTTHTDKEADNLRKKISLLNLDVLVFKLDVKDFYDRNKILLLDLDVLFLHAGVGYTGFLKDIDISLVKDTFDVNVFSNLELIQLFLKSNSKNKKILMTSSLLANHSCPYFGSYALSKSSIELMMKILRYENIFSNTKFIVIKPGCYHTGFNQYMILTGRDNINFYLFNLINKFFLLIEKKDLSDIVTSIVYAIEKGSSFKYSKPFLQALLLDK